MWCVVVCDLETSWMRRPGPRGAVAPKTNKQTSNCKVHGNFFTRSGSDIRRSSVLHFQRKYFEDKQLRSFRPSENWYSFHPLNYENLHFLDTAWRQLNTKIRLTPWQNSGCDCRQLYQISNWCVHHNSLKRHTEKLTQSNLFCLNRLMKPTEKFYCCFVYKQKKKKTTV